MLDKEEEKEEVEYEKLYALWFPPEITPHKLPKNFTPEEYMQLVSLFSDGKAEDPESYKHVLLLHKVFNFQLSYNFTERAEIFCRKRGEVDVAYVQGVRERTGKKKKECLLHYNMLHCGILCDAMLCNATLLYVFLLNYTLCAGSLHI